MVAVIGANSSPNRVARRAPSGDYPRLPVPRATVIVPNYNNGRASSRDGARDFLGELLSSLERTLADDPTDLEIVVADDGSTDDSLETARAWSRRPWPTGSRREGTPFLRLIELPHSGVLSKVLNALHAETEGDYVCRLDGDVVLDTPNWVAECVAILDRRRDAAVVTGLQKLPDGRVHAFGDAILSPLGYHHLGQGAREEDLPDELEVEHAMGCFHASRRSAIHEVGGYDESVLRGQTEELAMRLNLAGHSAIATKRVVFRHFHAERHWRPNTADTGAGLRRSLDRFRDKWGVDRLAPDLRSAWERWGATPLVRRASLSAPHAWEPAAGSAEAPGEEWKRFPSDADLQLHVAAELAAVRAGSGPLAILGSRSGLTALLAAREGRPVVAFEEHAASVEAARAAIARANSGSGTVECRLVESLERTDAPAGGFKIVGLLDSLERIWNPVGVLRESRRLLAPDGILVVRTRARAAALERRGEVLHPFAAHELVQLVRHVGGLEPLAAPTLDASGRLNMLARAGNADAHQLHFGALPIEPALA
jgi:glycosyltransferase involved in cell wall biosynthesis/SAM-dependent methyltransferase